jgi:hypothetical protein
LIDAAMRGAGSAMTNGLRGVTITAFNRAKYIFREHCQKVLQDKKRYYGYGTSNWAFL